MPLLSLTIGARLHQVTDPDLDDSGLDDSGPRLPAVVVAAHDEAVRRGEGMYKDPLSPNWVMTATSLAARGYCCGSGCRHCPYSPEDQQRHG